jgi:hypothetical protein
MSKIEENLDSDYIDIEDKSKDNIHSEKMISDPEISKVSNSFDGQEEIVINNKLDNDKINQQQSSDKVKSAISSSSSVEGSNTNTINTLDESVVDTLVRFRLYYSFYILFIKKRDLHRIFTKLKFVIIPQLIRPTNYDSAEIRNWDLWGPLVFSLILCM